MKKNMIIAGVVCIVAGIAMYAFNLDIFKLSLGDVVRTNIQVYPAAFFGLVGLVLVFRGLKSA